MSVVGGCWRNVFENAVLSLLRRLEMRTLLPEFLKVSAVSALTYFCVIKCKHSIKYGIMIRFITLAAPVTVLVQEDFCLCLLNNVVYTMALDK